MRDSSGISGQVRPQRGYCAEEAHRPSRGKRASEAEIDDCILNSNKVYENSQLKKEKVDRLV